MPSETPERSGINRSCILDLSMLFQIGILRYCGNTDFAKGQWAGVELHEPVGKNDGSVGGKTYFQCKPKHGMNTYDGLIVVVNLCILPLYYLTIVNS